MRKSRIGGTVRAGLLSAQEARDQLTDLCVSLLSDRTQINFCNRDKGKPSPVVQVILKTGEAVYVSEVQWNTCLIPILMDPQWNPSENPILTQDPDWFRSLIRSLIEKKYKENGY